jgi:membrane protein DedA with SNARE-associated domain
VKKNSDDNAWFVAARYLALLSTVPAAIYAGYLIGSALDREFSTGFLKIVFVVIGTAGGFVPIIWELTREN